MPYGLQYQSLANATASWSISGESVDATCVGVSVISQRDADRKALDCARTSAQSRLLNAFPGGQGDILVSPSAYVASTPPGAALFNAEFFKTDSASARCLTGTGSDTSYTASTQSIISQRDVDRKAVDWAKAAAQSMLRCTFTTYLNDTPGETTVVCSGGVTSTFVVPVGSTQSIRSQAEANQRAQDLSLQLAQPSIDAGCIVVAPPTLSFRQYDGPISYPASSIIAGDSFYLTEAISGTAKSKHSPKATGVDTKACSLSGVDAASGIIQTTFSGGRQRDVLGNETNTLSASVLRSGAIGAYDFPGAPGITQVVTSSTADNLIAAAVVAGGTFLFPDFVEYKDGNDYVREWRSVGDSVGYFAGQFGGPYDYTWCSGQSTVVRYSDGITPDMLGVPVARTGEAARTQQITSVDTTARTRSGTVTAVSVSLPVLDTQPNVTLIFSYRVTPFVGDAYDLVQYREEPISGPTLDVEYIYPDIVGAAVYLESVAFDYRVAVTDDFAGRASEDDVTTLAGNDAWVSAGYFVAPLPNTECWEDFSGYAGGAYQTLVYGRRWADNGTFRTADPTQAYDDFSGYASQTLYIFSQGYGWSEYGASQVGDFETAYDDFSGYTSGARSTFDFFGSTLNMWSSSGSSAVYDLTMAYDDFNSYVSSERTTFDFTGSVFTGSANEWLADGTSAVVT